MTNRGTLAPLASTNVRQESHEGCEECILVQGLTCSQEPHAALHSQGKEAMRQEIHDAVDSSAERVRVSSTCSLRSRERFRLTHLMHGECGRTALTLPS